MEGWELAAMCNSSMSSAKGGGLQLRRSTLGHLLRSLFGLSLVCTLGACEEKSLDWCIEDEDENAVPALGLLSVSYQGRYGRGPVSIEPFVKTDPRGVVIAQGCGSDAAGNLWRLRGGWIIPDNPSLPAQFERETEVFSGELIICEHAECLEGQEFNVMGGLFVDARGTISAYDPALGRFATDTRVTNGLQEEIVLAFDIHWTPRSE
jgi:hypothetical protein